LVTLPKNFWTRVLDSVVIQLYAGECTPSVDRAKAIQLLDQAAGSNAEQSVIISFTEHTIKQTKNELCCATLRSTMNEP